jgi:arginyl-tRNA synthetase
MFSPAKTYDYVDGFSPNLNKHLHLGHLSNFVYAKAFQSLGVGKKFVALLGDTLQGSVPQDEALAAFQKWCGLVQYAVDPTYFASKLTAKTVQVSGQGHTKVNQAGEVQDYAGTTGFIIDGEYVVGVKSNGETSYFYHDVALAEQLGGSTLYLTGQEQSQHFAKLHALFSDTNSVALGLVAFQGGKMSSSKGNVILLQELWDEMSKTLSSPQLIWNVLAGFILKTAPSTAKKVNLEHLGNPKNSPGLYLSYTLAKLKSAGLNIGFVQEFHDPMLAWSKLVAQTQLNPAVLMKALLTHAQKISVLYETHHIAGNASNQALFQPLAEDLLFGMKCLGLMDVQEV